MITTTRIPAIITLGATATENTAHSLQEVARLAGPPAPVIVNTGLRFAHAEPVANPTLGWTLTPNINEARRAERDAAQAREWAEVNS